MIKRLLLLLFLPANIVAQVYTVKNGHTRHRFAQTVVGLDFQSTYGGSSVYLNSAGLPESFNFSPQLSPRFYISGTHFWGHAEFYVAFQFLYSQSKHADLTYTSNQSDIFGIKIYPWQIKNKAPRPYAGFTMAGLTHRQGKSSNNENGPVVTRLRLPLIAGITYCHKKYLFDAGLSYSYDNTINYYVSPGTNISVATPPLTFRLGVRKWFEGTLSAESEYLNGRTEEHYRVLKEKRKLNSWFVGFGPSSSFFLKRSPYNSVLYPFLDNAFVSTFTETSAGYYHESSKIHAGLAYRNIKENLSAYGHWQQLKRRSLSLEAFRYLFDYHGFNPYAGICYSSEWLDFIHTSPTLDVRKSSRFFAQGLIFGWDIVPNKLQWIILRTNLRYFPDLKIKPMETKTVFMDQLEFNFIQVIVYPQRFKALNTL